MEKIYAIKAEMDADIAHLDKLSTANGHPIPETKDMHVSGSRITQEDRDGYDWDKILGQHICAGRKHPTKKQWALRLPRLALDNPDHVDPTSGHKLDIKDAVEKLPEDWNPDAITSEIT